MRSNEFWKAEFQASAVTKERDVISSVWKVIHIFFSIFILKEINQVQKVVSSVAGRRNRGTELIQRFQRIGNIFYFNG